MKNKNATSKPNGSILSTSLAHINEMEALADMLIQRGHDIKRDCHRARKKLEGVSTPSNPQKGKANQLAMKAIMELNKKIGLSV